MYYGAHREEVSPFDAPKANAARTQGLVQCQVIDTSELELRTIRLANLWSQIRSQNPQTETTKDDPGSVSRYPP